MDRPKPTPARRFIPRIRRQAIANCGGFFGVLAGRTAPGLQALKALPELRGGHLELPNRHKRSGSISSLPPAAGAATAPSETSHRPQLWPLPRLFDHFGPYSRINLAL